MTQVKKSTAIFENIHGSSAQTGSTHSALLSTSLQKTWHLAEVVCTNAGKQIKDSRAVQMGQPGVGYQNVLPSCGAHEAPPQ